MPEGTGKRVSLWVSCAREGFLRCHLLGMCPPPRSAGLHRSSSFLLRSSAAWPTCIAKARPVSAQVSGALVARLPPPCGNGLPVHARPPRIAGHHRLHRRARPSQELVVSPLHSYYCEPLLHFQTYSTSAVHTLVAQVQKRSVA